MSVLSFWKMTRNTIADCLFSFWWLVRRKNTNRMFGNSSIAVNFKGYKIHMLVNCFKVQSQAKPCKIDRSKIERVPWPSMSPFLHHFYAQFCGVLRISKNKKACEWSICGPLHSFAFYIRGPDQIRTGVGAFAELSLATRPQDLLIWHTVFQFSTNDLLLSLSRL